MLIWGILAVAAAAAAVGVYYAHRSGALERAVTLAGSINDDARKAEKELAQDPSWATRRQLEAAGRVLEQDTPERGYHLKLGTDAMNRPVTAIPWRTTLIDGPTGTGKTSALLTPSILEWRGPVIVTSPKVDDVLHTLPSRAELGDAIIYVPDARAAETIPPEYRRFLRYWDPLTGSDDWDVAGWRAEAIVFGANPDASGKADFWRQQAVAVLRALLHAAALTNKVSVEAGEPPTWTMGRIVSWLTSAQGASDEEVRKSLLDPFRWMADEDGGGTDANRLVRNKAFARLESLLRTVEETRSGILASTDMALRAYDASAMQLPIPRELEFTAHDVLNPERPATLYIIGAVLGQDAYSGLFAAMILDVINEAILQAKRNGGRSPTHPLFALDEVAQMAPIPYLDKVVSTLRSFEIAMVLAVQDEIQLDHLYGREVAQIVRANASNLVTLPDVRNRETLDLLSTYLIGDRTVPITEKTKTRGKADGGSSSTSTSTSHRNERQPFASPARISQLRPGTAILVLGGLRTVVKKRPWYEVPHLVERMETGSTRPSVVGGL